MINSSRTVPLMSNTHNRIEFHRTGVVIIRHAVVHNGVPFKCTVPPTVISANTTI